MLKLGYSPDCHTVFATCLGCLLKKGLRMGVYGKPNTPLVTPPRVSHTEAGLTERHLQLSAGKQDVVDAHRKD